MRQLLFQSGGDDAWLLRLRHAADFGSLLAGGWPEALVATSGPRDVALRLLAEEFLLAGLFGSHVGIRVAPVWHEELREVRPFGGDGPPLSECLATVRWVVVVPTHIAGRRQGELRRIWGFAEKAESAGFAGRRRLNLPGGPWKLRWSIGPEVTGESWQLGAWLASRAASSERMDVLWDLARHWVVTGAVGATRVDPVQAGNKVGIRTPGRRWLIPECADKRFEELQEPVHTAASLDEAWAHVAGEGTVREADEPWPEDTGVLHATVSAAVPAVIASILLCRPRRVVLWHSCDEQNSRRHADWIRAFFGLGCVRCWPGWRGNPPILEARLLADDDVILAERQLEELAAVDGSIIANITCGNLLMKLAMINVARRNSTLRLVYRELGTASPTRFVLLRHRGGIAVSSGIELAGDLPGVDWNCLARRLGDDEEPEAFAHRVFT